ncbi:hypothetical protein [Amycolatopsis sp. H20-H5]|uniref:hypothetical protein n=1 Tax=Amycolatopsis sp. H20-H5 TaxID=3046309 RepID=UPI002DB6664B|nr:hypothetical protein [Amycolatopsis sp. H20-H5]MEC3982728.1 hypothetical protein [Amycolatopsis sp. H20-H5]
MVVQIYGSALVGPGFTQVVQWAALPAERGRKLVRRARAGPGSIWQSCKCPGAGGFTASGMRSASARVTIGPFAQ